MADIPDIPRRCSISDVAKTKKKKTVLAEKTLQQPDLPTTVYAVEVDDCLNNSGDMSQYHGVDHAKARQRAYVDLISTDLAHIGVRNIHCTVSIGN